MNPRAIGAVAALFVFGFAMPAGAPPPLANFPAALVPSDGSSAPANTRLWAFGKDAPPVGGIGVAVTTGAGAVPGAVARLGCCLVSFTPTNAFPLGEVSALVTTGGAEATSVFTVEDEDDDTPPTLDEPVALDDRPGAIVLAVEGDDESLLAGFVARLDGEVVSAAADGFLLEVRGYPADTCVEVTALDAAGNESAPRTICDVGEPDAGTPEAPEPMEPGCSATGVPSPGVPGLALSALFGMLLLGFRRRRTHAAAFAAAAAIAVGVGCGPAPAPDAGPGADGGMPDGGAVDGGAVDGGVDGGPAGYATVLDDLDGYAALEGDNGRIRYFAPVGGVAPVDPVGDRCVFLNSAVFEYHLLFLRDAVPDFSFDDYVALTLVRETRAWWGGELWWRANAVHPLTNAPGVLLFLVYANDDDASRLTADDVRAAHATLSVCAEGFAGALAFAPGSQAQRQMAESERAALAADGIGVVLNPQ